MFETIYTISAVLTSIEIFVWILSRPGEKSLALIFACVVFSIISGVMWPLSWIACSIVILSRHNV